MDCIFYEVSLEALPAFIALDYVEPDSIFCVSRILASH